MKPIDRYRIIDLSEILVQDFQHLKFKCSKDEYVKTLIKYSEIKRKLVLLDQLIEKLKHETV